MSDNHNVSDQSEELHVLAKITGYFGVKGWVKLFSYTDPKDNIVRYKSLKIKRGSKGAQWQDIKLDNGKLHGKGVIAHFTGFDDRDTAASLIGSELAVQRSEFKATAKNEYYWTDLIGLMVVNQEGIELGRVTRLMETASHDVLVIKPGQSAGSGKQSAGGGTKKAGSGMDILIPFVLDHYINNVDLKAGIISVDWLAEWNEPDK